MKYKIRNVNVYTLSLMLSMSALWVGCSHSSSSSSSDSSDSISLSGKLNTGVSSQSFQKVSGDDVSTLSIDITSYKVVCSTQTTPPVSATSAIAADGSFNVSISGGANQPLSCSLVDANGSKKADFLISDSSKKDLHGKDQVSNTAAFKGSVALGSVDFDPDSGEVTVPASTIASSVVSTAPASSSVFDPTGEWTIGAVDFTVPNGVKGPCENQQNGDCDGPPNGQAIYLKMWKGKMTADSSNVYALQVWQGQSSYNTCGGRIGLSTTMKSSLGVDFSENGTTADQAFSFASSVASFQDKVSNTTGTVNLTEGWKMDTAKTQYDLYPCQGQDVTIGGHVYSAWKCGPDASSHYQLNLSGGCKDSDGNAVNLTDWSGVNNCQFSTDSNNIQTNSCSGTATISGVSKAVTCVNKFGVVNSSGALLANTNFDWSSMTKISSGTLCSAVNTSSVQGQLQQLQCYSNYYWQSGMQDANACLPRIDTDWSSTDPASFVSVSFQPSKLIFMEQYLPFADGSGGSLLARQEGMRGVQVSSNNYVNCRVIEVGGLSFKKISDSKLLATYQSSLITTSLDKPACLANFTGSRTSFMFYLTK